MNKLHEWLEAHRIAYQPIDREVVEIEGLGKLFLADLSLSLIHISQPTRR